MAGLSLLVLVEPKRAFGATVLTSNHQPGSLTCAMTGAIFRDGNPRAVNMIENDQYAISSAKTQYREAYNTGDVVRLLDVFASEFTDCSDGEPSFYGEEARRALRLRTNDLFQRYDVEVAIIIIDISVKGDFAFDWGWHNVRLTDKKTGDFTCTKYRYFETWKKENGVWKIDYIITNKELPPRMLPDEDARAQALITGKTG
jgi:ketosteroid isomerase-like protein